MKNRRNPFLSTVSLVAAIVVIAGQQAASAIDYNLDVFTGQTFTWNTDVSWNPDSTGGTGPLASDSVVITGNDLTGTTNINYEIAPNAAATRSITNITVTDSNNGNNSGTQINFSAGVAGSALQFSSTTPTVSTNIINQNSGANRLSIDNPLFQSATTFTKGDVGNVRLNMLTTTSSTSFSANVSTLTSSGTGVLWLTAPTGTTAVTLPGISFGTNNTALVLSNGAYTATDQTIALGTGRLSMGGTATLNLAGTSSISGGTVILGSNNSNEYYLGGNATINMNAATATFQNLNIGDQKNSNGTIAYNQQAGTTSISNAAFLGLPSSNSGASTQTFDLNISGGAFNFTRSATNTDFLVGRNGRSGTNTAAITLSGAVTVSATGLLDLGAFTRIVLGTDTSNYADNTAGTLNLNGGTLKTAREIACGTNSAVGGTDSSLVKLNGGTLLTTAAIPELFLNFGSTATNGILVSSGGAVIDTNSYNSGTAIALQQNAASTGGGLTKIGAGTLTLSAANTFTGDTKINAGSLLLANSLALQNSTFDSSGAGSLGLGILTAATLGGLTGSNNLALENTTPAAVALTVGGNNASTSYSGNLSGLGSLTKSGTGILTLSGTNSYAGNTTISGGVLAITTTAALPGYDTAGRYSVANGAMLAVGNSVSDGDITTMLATGNFVTGSRLAFDTTAGNRSYGSNFGGARGLTKIGANTLTLTAAQSYTGTTLIYQGTLALSGVSTTLPAATTLSFLGGATLNLGGNAQIVATVTMGAANFTAAVANGSLTVQGSATDLNLVPVHTGTGITTILDMSGLSAFTYNVSNKNVVVGGGGAYNNSLDWSLAAGTNTIIANYLNLTTGGSAGNLPFNKGIMRLGQTNTFNLGNGTGNAIFLSGYKSSGNEISFQTGLTNPTLKIRAANGSARAGGIGVAQGSSGTNLPIIASFDMGVADALVGDIIVADNNQLGAGANVTGAMTMAGGTLDATSMTLGKVSGGTTIPTGINTLSGSFTQNGGTATIATVTLGNVIAGVQVTGAQPNFASAYTLANGAVLKATTLNANPAGGVFRNTSSRTLNINGGTLGNITGANLTVSGADTTAAGRINIVLGGTTNTIDATSSQTIDIQATAPISGSGNLVKTGLGTLSLKGANTYSGETLVNAGTLEITTNGTLADGFAVRLTTGATLNLNFTGSDTVDRLFIDGSQKAAGTWAKTGTLGVDHTSDLITGDGILAVTNGPANDYNAWASLNGVTGGPNGDSDHDGVTNLVEYALADGTRGTLSGKTVSFTKRGAPWGGDLTYDIETSASLTVGSWTTQGKPPVNETAGSITFLLPTAAGKIFARLKVTQN